MPSTTIPNNAMATGRGPALDAQALAADSIAKCDSHLRMNVARAFRAGKRGAVEFPGEVGHRRTSHMPMRDFLVEVINDDARGDALAELLALALQGDGAEIKRAAENFVAAVARAHGEFYAQDAYECAKD
jgi:hypothetical protein